MLTDSLADLLESHSMLTKRLQNKCLSKQIHFEVL